MNRNAGMNAGQLIGTMNGLQVIGLDIAKHVFQLHTVDMGTGELCQPSRLPDRHGGLRGRSPLGQSVAGLGPHGAFVARQGGSPLCLGQQDRRHRRTGHLAGGAATGCEVCGHQDAGAASHIDTASPAFGATFAKGAKALFSQVEQVLEDLSAQLPQMVRDSLREQVARIKGIGEDIAQLDKRLALQLKGDADMRRVAQIPGVGLLTATAAIATMGQASAFKSGREFCTWLGLVPRQSGSGGKVRLGPISKRGDTYLRTLLMHGARSVLNHSKEPGPWLEGIKGRRPANVVIVAQAANTARAIWAVTAKQQEYQRGHQSHRPQAA
jgi:transposase